MSQVLSPAVLSRPGAGAAPPASALGAYGAELARALDRAAAACGDLAGVMESWAAVNDLLAEAGPEQRDAVLALVRAHPAARIAWQDPLTRRCFDRPRGYPGDPGLIDLVHGHPAARPQAEAATPAGRRMLAFTQGLEACEALRERRRLLAAMIDETVERTGAPEVLAVACGHLREIELARRAAEVGRLVALDGDGDSLAEIGRCYGALPVTCVQGVGGRPPTRSRFDLILAASALDDLDNRAAARLTAALFRALRPGGRLVLASFARGLRDAAYLDVLDDWRPALRDEEEMLALLDALPEGQVAATRLFRGGNRAVIYAVAARR